MLWCWGWQEILWGVHGGADCGLECARGKLVEADGYGLAQVHGGLAGIGGDFDEQMTEGQVFSREAVLFRAEDEGDAATAGELLQHEIGQIGKGYHWLFGLAVGEGSGAEHEGAVGDGLGEGGSLGCCGEQVGGADGGAGFTPVRGVGCDDGKAREAKVGHSSGDCSYVEGVARGDENDVEAVVVGELGVWSRQEMIVERGQEGDREQRVQRYNHATRVRMKRLDSRQAMVDIWLYALPVYLPFYQALLVAGIGRAIVLLLLTFLLMFLAANRAEIGRAVAAYIKAVPLDWLVPEPKARYRELDFCWLAIPRAPILSPLFQRPPPIFS